MQSNSYLSGSGYPRTSAGVPQTAISSSQPSYPMSSVARSNSSTIALQPQHSNASASTYTTALKTSESNSNGSNSNRRSAQKTLAHALLPDLPLLMHGSGDVLPENVHPHSVATLARLIEKYVASLVSAAMDAHDVFTDGEVVGGGACLGPPPYKSTAREDDDDDDDEAADDDRKRKASSITQKSKRKKQKKIDYWDEPLPPPPEDKDVDSDVDSLNDSEISDDSDDDAPLMLRRLSSASSAMNPSENPFSLQGIAPVDLHANERTRNYYVAAPTVMDARSFIFPICHDAVLYQRIKEVQASRRSIRRDVVDGALMEIIKEEGMNEGRRGVVDMLDAVLGGSAANRNMEGNESAACVGPLASSLADKKKGGAGTNKAHDKDKMKGADKKKEAENNPGLKSDNNDVANLVGAGLLDGDVDPSWPGLNALLRGRLW